MTLQDAVEEVKRVAPLNDPWNGFDISNDHQHVSTVDHAIATILNAVVKGELK